MPAEYRARPSDGIAWVTGASSGIGRGVSLELVKRGYVVVATARRLPELEALAREASGPGHVVPLTGDVTNQAAMEAVVDTIERQHGPVALAFLNAGTFFQDKAAVFDAEMVKKTFDINVGGVANGLQPLLTRMTARGQGQVAINASVAGYGGLPTSSAYGATKAALINMTESLRFSMGLLGVTMQIVNPGFVGTPLTDKNAFPMPFLIPVEDAARRICDGFERGGFEIAFPRRMAWLLKVVNLLPYRFYFPVVARFTGFDRRRR
jgi:NAD(P)-dependent dehydrogenase (short-subunit alcohol dehydrogenase family)